MPAPLDGIFSGKFLVGVAGARRLSPRLRSGRNGRAGAGQLVNVGSPYLDEDAKGGRYLLARVH